MVYEQNSKIYKLQLCVQNAIMSWVLSLAEPTLFFCLWQIPTCNFNIRVNSITYHCRQTGFFLIFALLRGYQLIEKYQYVT